MCICSYEGVVTGECVKISHDDDCLRGKGNLALFTVDCPRCEHDMATVSRGDFAFSLDDEE